MKVLVIANQKGGVGKTASLVHTALDFYKRGLKVVVVDLDTQGNASYTLSQYATEITASSLYTATMVLPNTVEQGLLLIKADNKLADVERITPQEASKNLTASLEQFAQHGFDVCLIDTAPSFGITMVSALIAANYVVSPIEPEIYSIQGISKMVTAILNLKKHNTKLNFLGMYPNKVDARNVRHKAHLAQLAKDYPQLMIPHSIGLRSSVADALATGIPVWESKKTAARVAAKEIKQLNDYLFEKMGLTL